MRRDLKVRIQRSFARAGVDVWLYEYRDGKVYIAEPVEIVFSEKGSEDSSILLPEPTLQLRENDWELLVRAIREELVAGGWTPKADVLQGELTAQTAHLKDMQRLIFERFVK